jgi:hypothetical protein
MMAKRNLSSPRKFFSQPNKSTLTGVYSALGSELASWEEGEASGGGWSPEEEAGLADLLRDAVTAKFSAELQLCKIFEFLSLDLILLILHSVYLFIFPFTV